MRTEPSSRRAVHPGRLAILMLAALAAVAVVVAGVESPPEGPGEPDDPRIVLMEALESGDRELAARVFDAGVDPALAVVDAARRGDLDALRWLVDRGAVIGGKAGTRALLRARRSGNPELEPFLRAHGADLDDTDTFGRTLLMSAAAETTKEAARLVSALIEAGADVNKKSPAGRTPLLFAVKSDRPKIVRALLAAGAEVDARDGDGWTPLMLAARDGRLRTVVLLLAAGADPNAQSSLGWTALMWASWYGHLGVAGELLEAGADPNRSSSVGGTALVRAVQAGRRRVVALLIAAGARSDGELAGVSAEQWAHLGGRLYLLPALRPGAV